MLIVAIDSLSALLRHAAERHQSALASVRQSYAPECGCGHPCSSPDCIYREEFVELVNKQVKELVDVEQTRLLGVPR